MSLLYCLDANSPDPHLHLDEARLFLHHHLGMTVSNTEGPHHRREEWEGVVMDTAADHLVQGTEEVHKDTVLTEEEEDEVVDGIDLLDPLVDPHHLDLDDTVLDVEVMGWEEDLEETGDDSVRAAVEAEVEAAQEIEKETTTAIDPAHTHDRDHPDDPVHGPDHTHPDPDHVRDHRPRLLDGEVDMAMVATVLLQARQEAHQQHQAATPVVLEVEEVEQEDDEARVTQVTQATVDEVAAGAGVVVEVEVEADMAVDDEDLSLTYRRQSGGGGWKKFFCVGMSGFR